MIENFQQLGVTQQRLREFVAHLWMLNEISNPGEDELIVKAHRESIASTIETLKAEIAEFEAMVNADLDDSAE